MTDIDMDDELRGSAPVMSAKALLLELYHDMKVVRPAVEELRRANLPSRVHEIEMDHAIRDAQGGAPRTLVDRVAVLEDINQDELAARRTYGRIASLSNKTLAVIVVVANAILGFWIAVANGLLG